VEIPQEYWLDRTLLEVVGAIGTPLTINIATQNRSLVIMAVFGLMLIFIAAFFMR